MGITRFDVRYEGPGGSLALDVVGMAYQTHSLASYGWVAHATPLVDGSGERLNRYLRQAAEHEIVLSVWSTSKAEFEQRIDRMVELFERDVLANRLGKLIVNGEYLECNVTAVECSEWERPSSYTTITLTVYAPRPVWVRETPFSFWPGEGDITTGKKYAYKYAYRYAHDGSGQIIVNEHYSSSPAIIVIYGYAKDPVFSIAGHQYQVLDTFEVGERVIIDQTSRTLTKIYANGTHENIFGKRGKAHSVFAPIPEGAHLVIASGSFGIDITLHQERSMPRWSAS